MLMQWGIDWRLLILATLAKPVVKGSYDIYNGQGVQVVGNYAYVADESSGLQIIDISNPLTPTLKGNYNTYGCYRCASSRQLRLCC